MQATELQCSFGKVSGDQYHGKSTPRPIRFNNRLWADFTEVARSKHLTAADMLRGLMMEVVLEYKLEEAREQCSSPVEEDVEFELELD